MDRVNCTLWVRSSSNFVQDQLSNGKNQLLRIELYVGVTAILLTILAVFGSTRRHWDHILLRAPIWVAYVLSSSVAYYVLGLIQSFSFYNESLTFWAVFLLVALARVDSMTAFSLDDNETWTRFQLEALLQLFLTGLMVGKYLDSAIMGWVKSATTARNMQWACMSSGLARKSKPIFDYMGYEHELSGDVNPDPRTMVGYNYLVTGEDEAGYTLTQPSSYVNRVPIMDDKVITLQKIWQCPGRLITSSKSGHLCKDLCLSYAFFRILLCRFGGYSLPIRSRQKSWNLVRDGLISGSHERVFGVIEMELGFLYDFFYTRYPYVTDGNYLRYRLLQVILVSSLASWAAASTFMGPAAVANCSLQISNTTIPIDTVATAIVLSNMLLVQFVQLFYIITSDWMKVKAICRYVRETSRQNNKWVNKMTETICSKQWKPWGRKLKQYSVLTSFRYNASSIVYNFYIKLAVEKPRDGQIESKSIGLPEEVKEATLASLKLNGPKLSNGEASLHRNGFGDQFSWACKLETTTHVILVWHMATSICEMQLSLTIMELEAAANLRNSKQFIVANSLSKYCAYLVAFLPKLLPDHSCVTEFLFDKLIKEARDQLFREGYETEAYKYRTLLELGQQAHQNSILNMGAKLGMCLVQDMGNEVSWKVLADFWAEIVLFLAPSEELKPHAEQLAKGGEFLTHLMALLFHAGIVNRDLAFDQDL